MACTGRGTGMIFFFGGGGGRKNVDMPSDCQNLGGGDRHIHPIETKSWGGNCPLPPPPPGSCTPVHCRAESLKEANKKNEERQEKK